jgi:uncharacterized protein YndB with AHSA1/START domain
MTFQEDPEIIKWHLHLSSPPEQVFTLIASDSGRARFWAESAIEEDGNVQFKFVNGWEWRGEILKNQPPTHFSVNYFDSKTSFDLVGDGDGGTDLTLTDEGVPSAHREEVIPGWVSVLMALKGAADFGVDLRNHDTHRSWDQGYCDN